MDFIFLNFEWKKCCFFSRESFDSQPDILLTASMCVTDLSPPELICGQEVHSNLVLTLIKENSEEGALWEKKWGQLCQSNISDSWIFPPFFLIICMTFFFMRTDCEGATLLKYLVYNMVC